ncbi:GIY-YIG nuclease family protein [Legionella jamestowniensis]|uniref:GIY-YIG nuclease family protein n=1 Tax=Legionella jamestowniensis TaxID=455 RepID=UPI0009F55B2E|nr:GIY-YIG nuclease family protein [Legionella jamestowniensis]
MTNNLEKRFKPHVDGSSKCKYTRSFKPIKISQTWEVSEGKAKALKIERYIKQLSRVEKEIIIAEPLSLQSIFNL